MKTTMIKIATENGDLGLAYDLSSAPITPIQVSRLKAIAVSQHGLAITPCSGRRRLEDCVQDLRDLTGAIMLYYNTSDNSTHTAKIAG